MTNKQKIVEYLKGKEKASYREIADGVGLLPKFVASIITTSMKKEQLFERLERGYYRLKVFS